MCKQCYAMAWRNGDPQRRIAQKARSRTWRQRHAAELPEIYKRKYVRSRYGLTLEEYEALLAAGCAICGTKHGLYLDHDHSSGKVRGALCPAHNSALGLCHDDPAQLRALADYLEEQR